MMTSDRSKGARKSLDFWADSGVQHLMRPPGSGIAVVSAGKSEADAFARAYLGKIGTGKAERYFEGVSEKLNNASVVMVGVPFDTGAGIRRGAAYGPRGLRLELLKIPGFIKASRAGKIFDLGDIFVNPHLLHDEMLNAQQIERCQMSMYSHANMELRAQLPVSALSQTEYLLRRVTEAFPHLKIFVIGGDHSVAWPVTAALHARYPGTLGIVQPDAHTDLLPERLGVRYCFGTWSFHAQALLRRKSGVENSPMVQLGIRQSGKERSHWEQNPGVRQYWADEILKRAGRKKGGVRAAARAIALEIVEHFNRIGIRHLYFSNDIDGTDARWASATGTPAGSGFPPEFLLEMIGALGESFELVGADLMELAPDLGKTARDRLATCALAARYAWKCLEKQCV